MKAVLTIDDHLKVLAITAVLVASPFDLAIRHGDGLAVVAAVAHADSGSGKGGGGNSGSGGGNSGSGSGNSGSDNSGSGNSGSGSGNSGSGSGNSGSGNSGSGNSNSGSGSSNSGSGGGNSGRRGGSSHAAAARIELTSSGVEIRYADGSMEMVSQGRYERRDAAGHTVEARHASGSDLSRLRAIASGTSIRNVGSSGAAGSSSIVAFDRDGDNIGIRYSNGWTEAIEAGQYELKDPYSRTVVRRPATRSDVARLRGAARN